MKVKMFSKAIRSRTIWENEIPVRVTSDVQENTQEQAVLAVEVKTV